MAASFLLFVKNLFEVKRKKALTFWEFNVYSWIASELSSCLHCYIMFWTWPAISHFTFHKSLKVLYDNLLNSNKPVKVAHFQKLAKQSVLCGALVTEKWLNNSFSESKKNFYPLIKWGTAKIYIFARFKFKYLTPHATSQLGLI